MLHAGGAAPRPTDWAGEDRAILELFMASGFV